MSYAMLTRKSDTGPVAKSTAAKTGSGGLRIGEPNDAFEQEADRVTDEVMAGGMIGSRWSLASMNVNSQFERKYDCDGSGEHKEFSAGKALQRMSSGSLQSSDAPPIVHEVLSSPGRPLSNTIRNFFEPRFQHDFSKVRVHTDNKASESAKSVQALAYTVDNDLVFGEAQYRSDSSQGRRLIAHELAHVIQQHGKTGTKVQRQSMPVQQDSGGNAVELDRHTGRDCRYPEHREVDVDRPPWLLGSGNPCRNDGENLNSTVLPGAGSQISSAA